MSEQPHALIEQRGHVLIVTMNRPQARNALSGPMMALMRAGLGPGRRRPGHPGVRADRGGRRVLRGRRPEGDDAATIPARGWATSTCR